MKQRERYEDFEEAIRTALDELQSAIWTALPCIVEDFDAATQTCSLQPTVQGKQYAKDGSSVDVDMPLLVNVPVYRLRGGGFAVTVPLVAGDEGVAIFSSRCIDGWWQNGTIQPQAEVRLHDLSDAMFFPGMNSQVNNLTDFVTTGIQIRNDAGDTTITLKNNEIDIVATTVKITGDLTVTGNVTAGEGTGDQVGLQTHKHPTAGTGAPSAPTPGT